MGATRRRAFIGRGLGRTLLVWFLLLALLPLLLVGGASYVVTVQDLRQNMYGSLTAVTALRARDLGRYFDKRLIDLDYQARDSHNVRLLTELQQARAASAKAVPGFVKSYRWELVIDEFAGDLNKFIDVYGYWDALIIDADGNILYSVRRHGEMGSNLLATPQDPLARAYHRAMESGRPAFSDFQRHRDSGDRISAFLVEVLVDDSGEKIGAIALELPLSEIDGIMRQRAGEFTTREAYLVGTDLVMRSDSILSETPTALVQTVDTEQTRLWRDAHGQPGSPFEHRHEPAKRYPGYRGAIVFGSHETIEVGGVRLGVIGEIEEAEAQTLARRVGLILAGMSGLTAVVILFVALLLARRIVRPLLALKEGAERIGGGDLEQEIRIGARNEIGGLADSFNAMLRSLRQTREKTAAQDWLKNGQAELNQAMRGERELAALGEKVIGYLAGFLQARIGALYLTDDQGHLRMIGSYAYDRRKTVSNHFEPGEGLVGQAALEGKPILLTHCPDDYISIRSGTGEAPPHSILVHPLVKDRQTLGVIELGSFDEFPQAQREFLAEISEAVATTLSAVKAQVRTQKLLEETRRQSEQLQAKQDELKAANERLQSQQEELRTTNEELQEQAQRLRASEESLQTQQEELRTTNEELQEQARRLRESEQDLQAQQEQLRVTNEELGEKNRLLEKQTRAVEMARRETEEKARDLARASTYKSQFLANMSHELRSPLNSLLLLADSLRQNKEGNLNAEQVQCAGIIHDSGNDLLSLINEILDLSKIEAGRMEVNIEPVDPGEVADGLRARYDHLARDKGVALDIRLEEGVPERVHTDRQRLEQILKNLLSNAIKFTEQGSIAVTFGRAEEDRRFETPGLSALNAFRVAVADTGIGLAEDQRKMIFEAFQQADGGTARRYGGTGLGLAISRELARLLGGEISLVSRLGEGSTFTLYLPLEPPAGASAERMGTSAPASPPTPDAAPPPAAKARCAQPASGQGGRVPAPAAPHFDDDRDGLEEDARVLLVIEDDERFAGILYQRAHEHGFRCLVALDGEEGLELARRHQPTAITLDLKLPGLDGWGVLSALKDDPGTRHIPVHIISGEEADTEGLRRGAIGHLTKPLDQEALEAVFGRIEEVSRQTVKHLLVVEDNAVERQAVVDLLDGMEVVIDQAGTGQAAIEALHQRQYDCIIVDLGLPDMDGQELLQRLAQEEGGQTPPVVVYTAADLSREQEMALREYAGTIILKDARSQERLVDEVSLFLHSVVSELPEQKRRMIADLRDSDAMLTNRRVLVVDDDMRTMFALSRLLSSHGMQVLKAENGEKALALLERDPDIELVLTDIMMPGMDGYETIRRIRAQERFGKLPVIALTAKAMREDRERCLAVGASDYLPKPVDQERLLSLLRVWLYR